MDDNEERIQRALNEAKKRDLEEKYGMDFKCADFNLPPELESQWLNYIEEFERQYVHARQTTVREFCGNPPVRLLAEIGPDELESELDNLLRLLESNDIIVHFDRDVTTEEAYRFVSVELLNEEIDDIRVEGMRHNFIYSEFHPEGE